MLEALLLRDPALAPLVCLEQKNTVPSIRRRPPDMGLADPITGVYPDWLYGGFPTPNGRILSVCI